jgi:RTX calcium-binding nonapeptide repeat (4 copies)
LAAVRRVLLVSVASLAMTGVAAGGTVKGTARPDTIVGTVANDVLYGYGGSDRIDGRGGNDLLNGGVGHDVLNGRAGNDRITSVDGMSDVVRCGSGRDIVTADLNDEVDRTCEVVSRRLSRDPYRGIGAQHATEVEPDSFAYGSTIVTAFQVGRYLDGGAANIGFSTSRDGGATWTTGLLPRLSVFSAPAGTLDRVSDPVVGYDRVHRTWMIATVGASGPATVLTISRSRNGVAWSAPVTAARRDEGDYDKEWVTCDNWRGSPFAGRCYLSYMDFEHQAVMTRRSLDGGRTWSAQAGWVVPPRLQDVANGVQPVVRPNGVLVIPFAVFESSGSALNEIAAIRSVDGGVSFLPALKIADLTAVDVFELRVPPLPSAAIDGSGTIYVSWSDCRFVRDCDANGLVVARSRDGIQWSEPSHVPAGGRGSTVNHFLPGLAAQGTGSRAQLALAYYSAPQPTGCNYSCNASVNAWLSRSRDGGRTWAPAQRVTSEVVRSNWLADTGLGRFLGDYISTSWVKGKPIPILSLASPPIRGSYRQEIFATTRSR